MEGLTPEDQKEYDRVMKQGNLILKGILILGLILFILYITLS